MLLVREADLVKNSPAIYRWGFSSEIETVREADGWKSGCIPRETLKLSRPLHGLLDKCRPDPSTKVLGYFHIVRSADEYPFTSFLGEAGCTRGFPLPKTPRQRVVAIECETSYANRPSSCW